MDEIEFKSGDQVMSVPTRFFEAQPEMLSKMMTIFFGKIPVVNPTGNSRDANADDTVQEKDEVPQKKAKLTSVVSGHYGADESADINELPPPQEVPRVNAASSAVWQCSEEEEE
ncbi:hypothetical protein KR084_000206 [Drosophila pseudotakahashii]|nr:hypothetical protein KR084_000206 [Drosophila pseudotakahashii]